MTFEILTLEHSDSSAMLDCHFETYTGSLWHVYIGGHDIYNLLSDAVIKDFERQYAFLDKQESMQRHVEFALDRYQERTGL
jgi:hypothetical protein